MKMKAWFARRPWVWLVLFGVLVVLVNIIFVLVARRRLDSQSML